jgi:transposase-like protein
MDKTTSLLTRSPLDSACVNVRCELYGQAGAGNLTVRKVYGKDKIRYLRCQVCGAEFSERKYTALWNTKVRETKAVAVGEHLSEGCSLKGTARLVKVDASTVRRVNQRLGQHGQRFHAEQVQAVRGEALEADERHGYATHKGPAWEAELMDPVSKFVIFHVQGRRNEALIRTLLEDGVSRLIERQEVVLFTDGESSYATLFPEIFGQSHRPAAPVTAVVHPSCASASHARWPMCRSSSTDRATGWPTSRSATPMAHRNGSTRCSSNWDTQPPTPLLLSDATARLGL